MAFVADDDKLLEDGQGSAGSGQGSALLDQTTSAPLVNAGGSLAGSNVSTAGVGKGGRGSFTNIQAYLAANKDNNTTGQALESKVGSAFDTEKSKIESDSAAKTSEGQSKVQSALGARQKAGEFATADEITEADENQMKQTLAGQYTAPKVAYTIGNEANQYSQQLNDDQGFNALLNQTYNQAAGGQMSTGQRALQNQLDVNNDQVAAQRQALSGKYKALESLSGTKANETNAALEGFQNQYNTEIGSAKSQLEAARQAAEAGLQGYSGKPQGFDMLKRKYEAISRMLGLTPNPISQLPTEGDYKPQDPLDKNQQGGKSYA